jgi:hypothetical protein
MTPDQWRDDPVAQRKTWITVGVGSVMLAALMLPSGLMHPWRWRRAQPQAPVFRPDMQQTRPPVQIAPAAPAPAPALPLAGKWKGAGVLAPNHGLCQLALEVTPASDGKASGYTTLFCQPPASDYVNGRVRNLNPTIGKSINPTSAILSGIAGPDGVTHFTVTKNIGVAESAHGCNMTTADATPFGPGRIAFEWHEEHCPGGQIVLGRAR